MAHRGVTTQNAEVKLRAVVRSGPFNAHQPEMIKLKMLGRAQLFAVVVVV
jgi:hypothetical protein